MQAASGADFLTGLALAYQVLTRLSYVASAIVWSRALRQAGHDGWNLSFTFLFSLYRRHTRRANAERSWTSQGGGV